MIATILLTMLTTSNTPQTVQMGDGFITGTDIKPYEYSWQQCSVSEGKWKNGPRLMERATIVGENILRIDHQSLPQPGVTQNASHYLDRASLGPIRSEIRFSDPKGNILAQRIWSFSDNGHYGEISRGGKKEEKTGHLSNKMYNAIILGIPLGAIKNWDKPVMMAALMTQFEASYTLTATDAGIENITVSDRVIPARLIDVHWKHNEIGDIYPPGPDASGGRYWVTVGDEPDLPRVIRYKTDSYVVEALPQYCPNPAVSDSLQADAK